jgi:hypothetical protein
MKNLAVVLALVLSGFVNAQPFKLSEKIGHTGEFWKLEILEDDSVTNFDEILWPDQRIKLLEPNVFASINEELTMSFFLPSYTYDYITTDVLDMYKICSAHWTSLTKNPSWDCVYFYHDRQNGFCYIILGKYIK